MDQPALEHELARLQRRLDSLESSIPVTMLLSHSFFGRALAVFGLWLIEYFSLALVAVLLAPMLGLLVRFFR